MGHLCQVALHRSRSRAGVSGGYTHRVGITNHRLLALDNTAGTVRFAYKHYVDHCRTKTQTIACTEFVQRLQLHLPPEHFVKIRHYGLLANCNRYTRSAARARACGTSRRTRDRDRACPELLVGLPACCPHCHQKADWVLVERVAPQHPWPRFTVPHHDSS